MLRPHQPPTYRPKVPSTEGLPGVLEVMLEHDEAHLSELERLV